MPKKGGKKGGKKGKKGKGKKKSGDEIEIREPPGEAVKRLLKAYEGIGKEEHRRPCGDLRKLMRHHVENEVLLTRFVVHPTTIKVPKKAAADFVMPEEVNLEMLIQSFYKAYYSYVRDIICWDLPLEFIEFAKLCLLIEKRDRFKYIRMLEVWNCGLSPKCALRLSETLSLSRLTSLTLDDNEIGDEGVMAVCRGLRKNRSIKFLSLCFCGATEISGNLLGEVASTTNLMELLLDGNDLGCEGFVALIEPMAEQAENDAISRRAEKEKKMAEEAAEQEAKAKEEAAKDPEALDTSKEDRTKSGKKGKKKGGKKGKGKKGAKKEAAPTQPGPYLSKLHVSDNGIDPTTATATCDLFAVASSLSRWLKGSGVLNEIDLSYNEIGNAAANIVQQALLVRKEEGVPKVQLSITCRLETAVFGEIYKLAGDGVRKRGRKGGGKGKKKGKKKK